MNKCPTFIIICLLLIFFSDFENAVGQNDSDALSGNLIIFHAGSLSVPMKEIARAFMNENPHVQVLTEAAGSLESARKITELKRECDVIASADYSVIDQLLIPEFASWNIKFASNEMAIVFTDKSRRSQEINKDNWYTIMLDGNIQIGRADPNSDPCGYRSVLVAKLAEKHYQQKDLANKLLQKNTNNIRPKETDLLALLETGNVDYIFLYRSVAEQHHLKYILLPDEVNLKQTEMAEIYGSVSVEINGKKPGEKMTQKGEPMVYGVTIPKNAPNKVAAMAFVQFLLNPEKGMVIMKKLGQDSVIPSESKSYDQLPDELKAYAKSELKTN
jgi:molybdate/tungstate transport system substrate-binding protein